MKLLLVIICMLCTPALLGAQIDLGKIVKKKVEKKAKEKTEEAVDKTIEGAEDAVKGEKSGESKPETPEPKDDATSQDKGKPDQELKAWSRYDFVPGEKIIFFDDLSGEVNGEFPSRWDLLGGNAENAKFGSDNVIAFQQSRTDITPLMKSTSYLPEVFTIEFDLYFHQKGNESYELKFDKKNIITIRNYTVKMKQFSGSPERRAQSPGWRHIAISFNKRALKVYFDQDRVLNIPNAGFKPERFSLEALSHSAHKGMPAMVKNIRVAEGGVDLYSRVVADGRFVTRGIHFESGKATVMPESYGVLKEIAAMMQSHPDLRFRIEGHTDSDGDDAFNMKLSGQRADAVRDALVDLEIDKGRFEIQGFGESKPVDTNNTPEGKANNRRVEFVKL